MAASATLSSSTWWARFRYWARYSYQQRLDQHQQLIGSVFHQRYDEFCHLSQLGVSYKPRDYVILGLAIGGDIRILEPIVARHPEAIAVQDYQYYLKAATFGHLEALEIFERYGPRIPVETLVHALVSSITMHKHATTDYLIRKITTEQPQFQECLMEHGKPHDHQVSSFRDAVFMAYHSHQSNVVQQLLEHHWPISLRTAAHMAARNDREGLIQYFQQFPRLAEHETRAQELLKFVQDQAVPVTPEIQHYLDSHHEIRVLHEQTPDLAAPTVQPRRRERF